MNPNDSVEVSVQLFDWDIYRFQVRNMLGRFWFVLVIPALMLGLMVFLFIVVLVIPGESAERVAETKQLLINAVPLFGIFAAIFLVLPYFSAVSSSKNPNLSGSTSYSFSPAGVSIQGPHCDSEVRWPAFIKAKEMKWAFLLYPQRNIAHLIPKRSFQSEEDVLRCRELLRQNIANFKSRK